MKKKSFYCLWLVALCSFVLPFFAACSNNAIVATISNKEALTAEWIAGDDDRSLELTFNPSSYNADNIETVVTSSNSNVVSASETKLSAIGPGTATISVAVAGTITDSVEVSVKTRQSVTPLQSFSIENTSELATVSCGLTYNMQPSFTPAEIFTKDNTTPIVEFGTEGILSYEGGYKLKALSVGSTSVSVTVKDKTVKFNVAVEIGVPTLEFTPVANFNNETCTYNVLLQTGEQTTTLKLPRVTARSAEGNDITDGVNVETTIEITDGTVTLGAGQHTINYSVTDPRDTTKSASKTLTINVLNSTFAINPTYSTNGISMFTESVDKDGNVSATPARGIWSESDATFNMQASTLYYAETTFTYNVTSDLPMFGLAHYKTLNETIADGDAYHNAGELFGRRCIESVMTSSGKFMIKDLKPTDAHWYENYNSDNIYLNSSFKDNATFTTMTIAIARTTDKMYTFVDGVLIKEFAVPADYSGATTPGIISCGNKNNFTASEMSVLIGTEANNKIVDMVKQSATATISNKSALNELWSLGGADRNVTVAYSSSLVNAGNTTTVIQSSNASVISVNGYTIKAVGAGTATIKLLLNGKQVDSIDLTVCPASVKSLFGNNPTYSDGSKAYGESVDASYNITATNIKRGELAATFNMEASTLYYAEATFGVVDTSNPSDYPAFGLAHYLALNKIVDQSYADTYDGGPRYGRVCVASIKSGSGATFLIGNLKASNERWWGAAQLYKDGNFQANDFTSMTIAIARTETKMYTFVNGVLVKEINVPEGYSAATTPGIITICEAGKVTISGVNTLSGTEAQNKINALTATNA